MKGDKRARQLTLGFWFFVVVIPVKERRWVQSGDTGPHAAVVATDPIWVDSIAVAVGTAHLDAAELLLPGSDLPKGSSPHQKKRIEARLMKLTAGGQAGTGPLSSSSIPRSPSSISMIGLSFT